ncbi:PA2928 family protein [Niabella aurantiaca]|uniref:PA2928 family protein n=1 Tax=Niabella aurantiaca TaxID=379900 RepID=UPI000594EFB0|nr:PA2928 family protein [Niabella aurantiaca]
MPPDGRIASGHDEYAWLPNALLFEQKNKTIAVGIKRHGDVYSYRETHGSSTKAMESSYYIVNYDVVNMHSITEKKLDFIDEEESKQPLIIGKDRNRIWIFTDQLAAYHSSTLEQVANRKEIERKNPALATALLNDAKYYRWNSENKTILIATADGTTWQLNTQSLEAQPYIVAREEKKAAGKRNLKDDLWRSGSERAFKSSQDTAENIFYGLYSTDELPVYAGAFRNDAAGSLDAVRSLWSASFNQKSTKLFIDKDRLKRVSDQKFLNAFFLINRNTCRAFHCTSPSGFIIAYKTAIGKNGVTNLARITRDGEEVWNIETKLKEIKGLDFTDQYLLIQSAADENNHLITKMYSIRLADGKMSVAGL